MDKQKWEKLMQPLMNLKKGDLPTLMEVLTLAVTTLDAVGAQEFADLSLHVEGVAGVGESHHLMLSSGQMLICPIGTPSTAHDKPSLEHFMLVTQVRNLLSSWDWPASKAARYFRCSPSTVAKALAPRVGRDPNAKIARFEYRARVLVFIDLLRHVSDTAHSPAQRWIACPRDQLGGESIENVAIEQKPFFLERILAWSLTNEARGNALH